MHPPAIAATNSYDVLPYPSVAFADTHPARIATIATWFGLAPPPVATSRVLELGCASGGNLIPLASTLPRATFLGLDASPRQIRRGRRNIAALELSNIELRDENVLDFDPACGEFDYIICHGVYSWVDQAVREKILDVCRQHLAAHGVAYVSYNTLPGWHARAPIRDLLVQFTRPAVDVAEQVRAARALLGQMEAAAPAGSALAGQLRDLLGKSDAYLYHEYLEADNQPCYFREFAERAAAAGLQFLGEARLADMRAGDVSSAARQFVENFGTDLVSQQQGLDFVLNRTFRRTLLCHDDVSLDHSYAVGQRAELPLAGMHLAAHVRPDRTQSPLATSEVVSFRTPAGATISASGPLTKAALTVLGESWPCTVPYEELLTRSVEKLGDAATVAEPIAGSITAAENATVHALRSQLLQAHVAGVIEIVTEPFVCDAAPPTGEPVAFRTARREALQGAAVTNRQHHSIALEAFEREVLVRLDGGHDRAAIVGELLQLAAAGQLSIEGVEGGGAESQARRRDMLAAAVERTIVRLTELALLDTSST